MAILIGLILLASLCESSGSVVFCQTGGGIALPTAIGGYIVFSMGLADSNGNYLVLPDSTLFVSLTPSTALGGFTNVYMSESGCGTTSSSIYVQTAGTFQVVIACSGFTSYTSDYFTVLLPVSTVVVSINSNSYGVYQSFTVTVTAKDSTGATTADGATITLTETGGSTIHGTTAASNAGVTTFSIYFTNTGLKTIQATCDGYSGSASTTTYNNVITISSVSPTVRIT